MTYRHTADTSCFWLLLLQANSVHGEWTTFIKRISNLGQPKALYNISPIYNHSPIHTHIHTLQQLKLLESVTKLWYVCSVTWVGVRESWLKVGFLYQPGATPSVELARTILH